ncbi:Transposable element P transposase [Frankliniella fusca]|uniref:Transposable element P transposase n=1 Tax=Frankliniella fusca TaxID=407009 RepID=A0AAE1GQR3_9NEOP|nr:Transposable element P transposase [Frankliniella fusca]
MGKSGNKVKRCVAIGCSYTAHPRDGKAIFHFPNDAELQYEWLQYVGDEELYNNTVTFNNKNRFLCPGHFNDKCFWDKRKHNLKRRSVPTIFLNEPLSSERISQLLSQQTCQQSSCHVAVEHAAPVTPEKGEKRSHPDDDEDMLFLQPDPKMLCTEPPPTPSTPRRPMESLGARERARPSRSRMSRSEIARMSGVSKITEDADKVAKTALQYRQMAKKLQVTLIKSTKKSTRYRKLFNSKTLKLVEELSISATTRLIVKEALKLIDSSRDTLLCPDIVSKLAPKDRHCVLLFDEIFLRGHLRYVSSLKMVHGFEDYGPDGRTHLIADHALGFMVQGLNAHWVLPIAFYLVSKTCPSTILKKCIKSVIRSLRDIGLTVVASVSDQGPTNRSTIRELKEECGDSVFYCVDQSRVYHVWDVPHLMKSVRNNLLTSNLIFGSGKLAKWRDVIDYYNLDNSLCKMSVLTRKHVDPKGRDKMRVSLASQALGSRTANGMEYTHRVTNGEKLPSCMDTVEFIRLIDFYFDICNGPRASKFEPQKSTRCDVTADSLHLQEWHTMRNNMKNWIFVRKKNGSRHVPPCVTGWLENAVTLKCLWIKLQNLCFKTLRLRSLNQDALENFFGLIRQCGGSSSDLTCEQFVGALKTCLISRYTSQIRGKNCQDDESVFLSDLKLLIQNGSAAAATSSSSALLRGDVPTRLTPVAVNNPLHRMSASNLWLSTLAELTTISQCKDCRNLLSTNQRTLESSCSSSIMDKYPSSLLITLFLKTQSVFERKWRSLLFKSDVFSVVRKMSQESANWSSVFCAAHQLGDAPDLLLEKVAQHLVQLKIKQCNASIKAGVARYSRQACSSKNSDGLHPEEEELELVEEEALLLADEADSGCDRRTPSRTGNAPLQTPVRMQTPLRTPNRPQCSTPATPAVTPKATPVATPIGTPVATPVATPQIPLTPRQQARQKVLSSWEAPGSNDEDKIKQLFLSGEIDKLKVPDLKNYLKLKKLKVSGLKEELKTRLKESVGL